MKNKQVRKKILSELSKYHRLLGGISIMDIQNNESKNTNEIEQNSNEFEEEAKQTHYEYEEVNVNRIKTTSYITKEKEQMDRVKRIWYLSPMRAAKVQASLRIRAVSPEPPLLAHTSSESRGTFRQKARSLSPLNGWACAVKICHDGMLEDKFA